jgi:radical SAM protein with 4Fe4S-binding SPASM domain
MKIPVALLEKKQEYLVRRIAPEAGYDDLLAFPSYFEIETVNACNARCPMCTIDDWTRAAKPMTQELFEKIAAELCAQADRVKRVSLYRDGEPLLDKRLPERVALLKAGGIGEVAISTNVSLLTPARSRALLEAGLDLIILSIDSLDKAVFESIRVRLKFEEVLQNALQFIELRNRIRPSTRIWVRMIRQASNLHEWDRYQEFWRPKLAAPDRCYYNNIHNWGGQLKDFAPVVESLQPKVPCIALWSLMVIFSTGDVPLCNVDYNMKFPVGNVRERSIADVWNSEPIREFRQRHLDGRKSSIALCGECNVWDEPPDYENLSDEYVSIFDSML